MRGRDGMTLAMTPGPVRRQIRVVAFLSLEPARRADADSSGLRTGKKGREILPGLRPADEQSAGLIGRQAGSPWLPLRCA